MRLIQCDAVDRILELSEKIEAAAKHSGMSSAASDGMSSGTLRSLKRCLPFLKVMSEASSRPKPSLRFLERHFEVNRLDQTRTS